MMNFRPASVFAVLSAVALASLFALRGRAASAPNSRRGARKALDPQDYRMEESTPSWPPPEDMYWGM